MIDIQYGNPPREPTGSRGFSFLNYNAPMLGNLIKTVAIVSLMAAVVTVAWCIRSFQVRDTLTLTTGSHTIAIDSSRGLVRIWVTDRPVSGQSTQASHLGWEMVAPISLGEDLVMGRFKDDSLASKLGFGINSFSLVGFSAPPIQMWQLLFPQWFAALLFVLPASSRALLKQRKRRLQPNACVNCGYDLRASGTQCPECGKVRSNEIGDTESGGV